MLLDFKSNAAKFVSTTNRKIRISANLQNEGANDQLVVNVANNGPGISEEDQRKLLKPFIKLKDTNKINLNGAGLGWNIFKKICRDLGGDIEVSSRPEDWTKFTFWVNVRSNVDYEIADVYAAPSYLSSGFV